MSNSNKRISVFDRLGPGTDEGSPHHRYGSEKHGTSGYGGGQEKGRGHSYGSSGGSQHKDDGSQGSRERKLRHKASGEGAIEGDGVDDKRPSVKGCRDNSEVPVKVLSTSKTGRAGMLSGESDFEEGAEDGKRRKSHRALLEEKNKHGMVDDDAHGSRRSGRERTNKGGGRSERSGTNSSGDGLAHKSPDKSHSRREGVLVGPHDHKRRKEEEYKPEILGHKRKRDIHDDDSLPPDPKKSRRRDLSRESDHHRHSTKEGDRYYYSNVTPTSTSGKDSDYHYVSSTERKRRSDLSSVLSEPSRRRARPSQTPEPPDSGLRGKPGRSYHKHDRDDGTRRPGAEGPAEHRSEGNIVKSRSLDWTAVQAFSEKANSKLQHQPSSVLDRFKPGLILKEVKVSPALAGTSHYQRVREAILRDTGGISDMHSEKEAACAEEESSELKSASDMEENVASNEIAISSEQASPEKPLGTEEMEEKVDFPIEEEEVEEGLTWGKLAGECLISSHRALTAADDYSIRRRLRKDHKGFLATSRPSSDRWTTDQYASSIELYNFVATKPSGKPATKEISSRVGSLIISR